MGTMICKPSCHFLVFWWEIGLYFIIFKHATNCLLTYLHHLLTPRNICYSLHLIFFYFFNLVYFCCLCCFCLSLFGLAWILRRRRQKPNSIFAFVCASSSSPLLLLLMRLLFLFPIPRCFVYATERCEISTKRMEWDKV